MAGYDHKDDAESSSMSAPKATSSYTPTTTTIDQVDPAAPNPAGLINFKEATGNDEEPPSAELKGGGSRSCSVCSSTSVVTMLRRSSQTASQDMVVAAADSPGLELDKSPAVQQQVFQFTDDARTTTTTNVVEGSPENSVNIGARQPMAVDDDGKRPGRDSSSSSTSSSSASATSSGASCRINSNQPEKEAPDQQQQLRRCSQELSTVSEASDEANNSMARSKPDIGGSHKRTATAVGHDELADKDLLLTTEQDLAQSEYTLKSSPTTATATAETDAALDAALTIADSSEIITATNDGNDSISSANPGAGQAKPTTVRQSSREELLRRRSAGSGGSSGASGSGQPGPVRMKSPIDCPYVHDLIASPVCSPTPPASISANQEHSLVLRQRLSHDDTMEAIEDDVEGEEQAMQADELDAAGRHAGYPSPPVCTDYQQQQLSIAPPPAFSGSDSIVEARVMAITEEDEEEELADDDNEESSISVSQHGVLVISQSALEKGTSSPGYRQSSSSKAASSASSSASLTGSTASSKSSPTSPISQSDGTKTPSNEPAVAPPSKEELEARFARQHSISTESQTTTSTANQATQAILDHLSRHHPVCSLPLEEPALALEQSRSVDPQSRREFWRREAESARGSAQTRDETVADTGTIKRKSIRKENEEPRGAEAAAMPSNEETAHAAWKPSAESSTISEQTASSQAQVIRQQRRGPPLAQLKKNSNNENELQQQQQKPADDGNFEQANKASYSQATTDTSICSSCSCMTSIDAPQEQPAQLIQGPAAVASKKNPQAPISQPNVGKVNKSTQLIASGPSGERAAWMSLEEGSVFTENYWLAHWLYISELEESEIWRRAIDMNNNGNLSATELESGDKLAPGMPKEMNEMSSTQSERNFSTKYKSTTRKMIHRRATIEMYKRIMENKLKREKRVEISRSNGEFGFRIHGSRPVVVSAIERGTSAETCGLQVGDLIYAINGTNILDMAHSDVVKLAHNGKFLAKIDHLKWFLCHMKHSN